MKRLISGLGVIALALGVLAAPARAQHDPGDTDVAPIIAVLGGFELMLPEGTEVPPELVLDQVVSGQSWAVGDEVQFVLNGTYVATSIAEQNAEGSATPFFDLGSLGVTIEPGDEITLALADGSRTEVHVVQNIDLSEIDITADSVSGLAAPGSELWVVTDNDIVTAHTVIADVSVSWLADFAGEYDLVEDSVVTVLQFDQAGNVSMLLRAAEATGALKTVTREHIVQDFPDDVPDPSDRNIVCPNDGPAEYAYFFVSGKSEADLFQVDTPGGDRTRFDAEYVDVTAVLSADDPFLDPVELDGSQDLVEGEGVGTTTASPNGSVETTLRAMISITDPVTGEVVDTVDFFTIDRGDGAEFIYDRGNCG